MSCIVTQWFSKWIWRFRGPWCKTTGVTDCTEANRVLKDTGLNYPAHLEGSRACYTSLQYSALTSPGLHKPDLYSSVNNSTQVLCTSLLSSKREQWTCRDSLVQTQMTESDLNSEWILKTNFETNWIEIERKALGDRLLLLLLLLPLLKQAHEQTLLLHPLHFSGWIHIKKLINLMRQRMIKNNKLSKSYDFNFTIVTLLSQNLITWLIQSSAKLPYLSVNVSLSFQQKQHNWRCSS